MALVIPGKSTCPICGNVIKKGDAPVGTSGAFVEREHFLWSLCDAVIHRECFDSWAHRDQFCRLSFDARRAHLESNPFWHIAYATDAVIVSLNPAPSVATVAIGACFTCGEWRLPLSDWNSRLDAPTGQGAEADKRLTMHWSEVRKALPTVESLMSHVDRSKGDTYHEHKEAEKRQRAAELTDYNKAAADAAAQMLNKRAACPHCGARRTSHRFHNGASRESSSFFVCEACSRSFSHEDISNSGD